MQSRKWYFCDSFLINFLNSLYKICESNTHKQYVETQRMNEITDKRLFISELALRNQCCSDSQLFIAD